MSVFCNINERSNTYYDGECVKRIDLSQSSDNNFLTAVYRTLGFNYPKFFKMDDLSKAGLLVAELAVGAYKKELDPKTTGVVFFNADSSIYTDRNFEKTIEDADNFFPSPSLFVYTLPNIVSGEVCIRHGFQGESSFYVLANDDEDEIHNICSDMLAANSAVVCGWLQFFAGGYVYARAEILTAEDLKN